MLRYSTPLRRACMVTLLGAAVLFGCRTTTEVQSAHAKWLTNQPVAYAFTMQRICFCAPVVTRPVVVSVRNGVVESRTYEDTGADVSNELAQLFPAIDGLFAIVDDAVARKADSISADYDQTLGFPVRVAIDYVKLVADEELTFTVRDFKVR